MNFSQRDFLKATSVTAAAMALGGCLEEERKSQAKATVRPNFLIWVADDQFLESVGCYGGNP